MTILIVVESARVEELLLAHGYQDLTAKLPFPVVEEVQRAVTGELPGGCCELPSECDLGGITTELRITTAMAVHHVQPAHVCTRRDCILIHTKAARVREVRTDIGQALEDVPAFCVGDGNLCLQRCIRDV